MTEPTPSHPHDPTASVQWFGKSHRLVGGQPDTHYGWWPDPDGQGPCVVKALSPDLTVYADTLLQHERAVLQRLADLGAPAPEWVAVDRPHWLVTRFAGLSMQRLQHSAGFQGKAAQDVLSFPERMSVWIHLLRRLQPLGAQGILVVDLHAGNVVVPLTHGTCGQLRLTQPQLIDHAHTLEAGMAMTRPIWVNHQMQRLAPELRRVLDRDQAALRSAFENLGADLPGRIEKTGPRQAHNRKTWAQYSAPQQLQALLDGGRLNAGAVMQFAVGSAMLSLVPMAPAAMREALAAVLRRMTAPRPSARYPHLLAAAQALNQLVPALPLVSANPVADIVPTDLVLPEASQTQNDALNRSDRKHSARQALTRLSDLKPRVRGVWPDAVVWWYVALGAGVSLGWYLAN